MDDKNDKNDKNYAAQLYDRLLRIVRAEKPVGENPYDLKENEQPVEEEPKKVDEIQNSRPEDEGDDEPLFELDSFESDDSEKSTSSEKSIADPDDLTGSDDSQQSFVFVDDSEPETESEEQSEAEETEEVSEETNQVFEIDSENDPEDAAVVEDTDENYEPEEEVHGIIFATPDDTDENDNEEPENVAEKVKEEETENPEENKEAASSEPDEGENYTFWNVPYDEKEDKVDEEADEEEIDEEADEEEVDEEAEEEEVDEEAEEEEVDEEGIEEKYADEVEEEESPDGMILVSASDETSDEENETAEENVGWTINNTGNMFDDEQEEKDDLSDVPELAYAFESNKKLSDEELPIVSEETENRFEDEEETDEEPEDETEEDDASENSVGWSIEEENDDETESEEDTEDEYEEEEEEDAEEDTENTAISVYSYEEDYPEEESEEEENEDVPDNDIWDDEGRAEWSARERYLKMCRELPYKQPKKPVDESEKPSVRKKKKAETSGYRYEFVTRVPITPEGRNVDRHDPDFIEQEKSYCRERESIRSKAIRGNLWSSKTRMLCTGGILFVMLVLEFIGIFVGLTAGNVLLFSCIEIGLLLIDAVLILDSIKAAFQCLVKKGMIISELTTTVAVLLSFVYNIILISYSELPEKAVLLGTPAAVAVFLTAVYRYYMIVCESKSFGIASSYGRYVTEAKMVGYENLPEHKSYGNYAPENSSVYKINRVSYIDGCYNSNPVRDECFKFIKILTICSICAAAISGIVFGILSRSTHTGIFSAYLLMMLASPFCVFMSMFLPRLKAANNSAAAGGAIIGFSDEDAELENSIFMIDDGELFPPENLSIIKSELNNSCDDLEVHLARGSALLHKIGGTIAGVFSNFEGDLPKCGEVVITEIAEKGISAEIDGTVVRAGSADYLKKYGILVSEYHFDVRKNVRALYMADDGQYFVRVLMAFDADTELCMRISALRNTDTLFSLKTCNPCIDSELLFYATELEPELLRLVKYKPADDVAPAETEREGILVSGSGTAGLLAALLEYKRQRKLVFRGSRFASLSCVIGAALALIISASGVWGGFTSLIVFGFHAVMAGLALFIGNRGAINTKRKQKKH